MRIAQVSTLAGPVHRDRGGSIEQLIWFLARELTGMGHEVTVFGAAGSNPMAELVATLPGPYATDGSPDDWQLCEWMNLCRAVEQSGRFDVLHSHAYLWGIPLERLSRAPMVHTLHTLPGVDSARLWKTAPQACVTAISEHQWNGFPECRPAAVVHHGVDPAEFTFREAADDYVCFLGRFLPDKGVLAAIEAAKFLGLRLMLAGPRNEYYQRCLEPLVDGRAVEYVGWVSGAARDRLLGGARALLYPLQRAEPFGLVLLESMMCGTPVAAMNIGAVPEIIDEGVTGSMVLHGADFPAAVSKALHLDRARVRDRAVARFSAEHMARGYAQVYRELLHLDAPPRVAEP